MDEEAYSRRIALASDDPVELGKIASELQQIGGPDARRLRMTAILKRMKAHSSHRAIVVSMERSREMPVSWLAELGIREIDGRPLYRYEVSEDGFHALKDRLRERRAALWSSPSRELSAQFVLWAAEWFRRSYAGSGLSWDELNGELGASCEWRHWRQLTDDGLRFWRIKPLKLNGRHYRLAAIARQGGFPLNALERAQGGWAASYLEALVARLAAIATPDFETANAAAERLIELVPPTWQNEGMRIVCAELAMEVVRLRHLAEENGVPAGALVSVWLDNHLPSWRAELPLSIGSDAARTLIDGLMRTVALRGGHEAVRCHRWLEAGPNDRHEGVSLELSGLLDGKPLSRSLAADWSRLRMYPSGSFAQHVTGELAVADPDEEGAWRARPSIQRTRFAIPSRVPITAELRGDGQRVGAPFVLPGGEAVTGDLRVYTIENETNEAATLSLVGIGSGAFRDEILVLDVPTDWRVQDRDDEISCEPYRFGNTRDRTLWKISGEAVVTSRRGDKYLIRAGQKKTTRDRLQLHASNVSFEIADPTIVVIVGKPSAQVEEHGRRRSAGHAELFWRQSGTSGWQQGIEDASVGRCEFAWRDRETGHIRDRRDAVVLPASFAIRCRLVGNWQEVSIGGWPGQIATSDGLPHTQSCWRIHSKGNTRSRFRATLNSAACQAFEVIVPIRHQAWIENWTDGPVVRGASISLSVMNRYVARTAERCELMADLLDEDGRSLSQGHARWWVDGEMPLSAIRDDLAALLRPIGKLRASIRLNFNDANEDYWFVTEFEHELRDERGGLVPEPAVAEEGVRVIRRFLQDPTRELDTGRYDLLDSLNHRPIILPRQQGDTLVYLRAEDRVLSCPRLIPGSLGAHAQSPLARAMTISNWQERRARLEEICLAAVSNPTSDNSRVLVRQLVDLALSLEGLPPGTFDALAISSNLPELATMMLFQARQDELERLLRLAEGLPFAWWLMHKAYWDAAAEAQAAYLFARVPDELELVAGAISETRHALTSLEPILAPLLEQPIRPVALETAANSFLNRSGDRIASWNSNPFRVRHRDALPAWRYDEQFWRTLDAPVVAALAALGQLKLNETELMAAKDIARRHPQWFKDGFATRFKEI